LSDISLHYSQEASQLLVDPPKLMRGEFRRIGDTFVRARHLLVPNGGHEWIVEKGPITVANLIGSYVVCRCLEHAVSRCLVIDSGSTAAIELAREAARGAGHTCTGSPAPVCDRRMSALADGTRLPPRFKECPRMVGVHIVIDWAGASARLKNSK
jgi:hypothetical protein